MITQEPTLEMVEEWKAVWKEYKDQLKPNRKSGQELLDYLLSAYVLTEITDKTAVDVVSYNVTMNKHYAEKLPPGTEPFPKTYYVENAGSGQTLYAQRDALFKDTERIFVGIDLTTGYYLVEGSSLLWDELCAFQGLDESDLQNFACTAQYIACLQKLGKWQTVKPLL